VPPSREEKRRHLTGWKDDCSISDNIVDPWILRY
jgi:hypothetical protein